MWTELESQIYIPKQTSHRKGTKNQFPPARSTRFDSFYVSLSIPCSYSSKLGEPEQVISYTNLNPNDCTGGGSCFSYIPPTSNPVPLCYSRYLPCPHSLTHYLPAHDPDHNFGKSLACLLPGRDFKNSTTKNLGTTTPSSPSISLSHTLIPPIWETGLEHPHPRQAHV